MNFLGLLWMELKYFTNYRNMMYIYLMLFQPLVYLSLIYLMKEIRVPVNETRYILAVSLFSTWGYVLYSSGSALIGERWRGTFNLLLGSATPLFRIVLSKVTANSLVGLLNLLITCVYAVAFFGFHIEVPNPQWFVVSILVMFAALTGIGALLAIVYILFTNVYQYQNLILLPIPLLSGLFYPTEKFPTALEWLSHLVPMKWAVQGMYGTLEGVGNVSLTPLVISLAGTVVYGILAYVMIRGLEYRLKESGTLGVF